VTLRCCLYVRRVSVCLSAKNSGTGRAVVTKFLGLFQGIQGMVLGTKNLGVIGRGLENLHFVWGLYSRHFVCLLITRECEGSCLNFQGSFRVPRGWFLAPKIGDKNLWGWGHCGPDWAGIIASYR